MLAKAKAKAKGANRPWTVRSSGPKNLEPGDDVGRGDGLPEPPKRKFILMGSLLTAASLLYSLPAAESMPPLFLQDPVGNRSDCLKTRASLFAPF